MAGSSHPLIRGMRSVRRASSDALLARSRRDPDLDDLHGSLVLGDYAPPASDIDLLAIVERPRRNAEAESLIRGPTAREAPARVDLRVVTRAAAAAPRLAPPMEL
jgi:hypothetical protein